MSMEQNGIDWSHVDRRVSKTGIETSWQPYGIPDIMDPNRSRYSNAGPMPKWEFPEKVFISAAINGAFFTKRENPNQPGAVEEIIASAEECIKGGGHPSFTCTRAMRPDTTSWTNGSSNRSFCHFAPSTRPSPSTLVSWP